MMRSGWIRMAGWGSVMASARPRTSMPRGCQGSATMSSMTMAARWVRAMSRNFLVAARSRPETSMTSASAAAGWGGGRSRRSGQGAARQGVEVDRGHGEVQQCQDDPCRGGCPGAEQRGEGDHQRDHRGAGPDGPGSVGQPLQQGEQAPSSQGGGQRGDDHQGQGDLGWGASARLGDLEVDPEQWHGDQPDGGGGEDRGEHRGRAAEVVGGARGGGGVGGCGGGHGVPSLETSHYVYIMNYTLSEVQCKG